MEVVPTDAHCLLRTRSRLHPLPLTLRLFGLGTAQKPLRTAISQTCLLLSFPFLVWLGVCGQESFSELIVLTCLIKLRIQGRFHI